MLDTLIIRKTLATGRPLVAVDTVTDVLRVACQVSAGDVTLRARPGSGSCAGRSGGC